jgi:hypothetical protein
MVWVCCLVQYILHRCVTYTTKVLYEFDVEFAYLLAYRRVVQYQERVDFLMSTSRKISFSISYTPGLFSTRSGFSPLQPNAVTRHTSSTTRNHLWRYHNNNNNPLPLLFLRRLFSTNYDDDDFRYDYS